MFGTWSLRQLQECTLKSYSAYGNHPVSIPDDDSPAARIIRAHLVPKSGLKRPSAVSISTVHSGLKSCNQSKLVDAWDAWVGESRCTPFPHPSNFPFSHNIIHIVFFSCISLKKSRIFRAASLNQHDHRAHDHCHLGSDWSLPFTSESTKGRLMLSALQQPPATEIIPAHSEHIKRTHHHLFLPS